MRFRSALRALVLIALLLAHGDAVWSQGPKGGHAPSRVEAVPIERREVGPKLTLLGDVEAYTEGDVHSEVEGLAESFPVKEGDFVREGQVLARLNSSQLTLMLEKFRRDKEESRVLHEKEQSEFDRYKALSRSHSISHLQLEKEQSEADSTRFKMLMLETEIGRIEDRLSKMTIKAPFDGYVVQEYVHVGMWVTAGGKIVRMVEVDPIYVRVAFPQKDLPKLSLGQKAEVRIEGLGAARLPGKVSAIISKGEIASRTFPVKIELPNPGHRLKPGMLAYATFGLGKEHSALVVPKDAVVITPAQQKLLYVVENGKAKQVRVQTGQAYGSMIEVIGTGLKEGQQVVTVGNERLRPGVPVQIVGADTEGKPPSPLTQKTKLTGSPAK